MKLWVLAGIFSAAMTPAAFALTTADPACPADAADRTSAGLQPTMTSAATVTPVSMIKRAASEQAAPREGEAATPTSRAALRERQRVARPVAAATPVRARKNPRPAQARIPDSVLIGGDGAL